MKESEILQHLLDTLREDYDRHQRELATLDPKDEKYVPLGNMINRQVRSILATCSLMRDPKRRIMFDHDDVTKRDIATLAREIIEDQGSLNKKQLLTYKDAKGNVFPLSEKTSIMIHKIVVDSRRKSRAKRKALK